MNHIRSENRLRYLEALDQRSREDAYGMWHPSDLVDDLSTQDILDALNYWEQKGYIQVLHSLGDQGLSPARITSDGQDYLDQQQERYSPLLPSATRAEVVSPKVIRQNVERQTPSCFVIMPFQDPFNEYYAKIIKPAITDLGLTCVRADEISKPGVIIDQIWNGIREATLCVAELTGQRGNVMYELGLAHAVYKPVISLVQSMDDVPFDLKHLRHVVYKTSAVGWETTLRSNMQAAIRELIHDPDQESSLAFKHERASGT